MGTAPGRKFRIMVQCGGQPSRLVGLRIAPAAGCMSLIGDGLGFRMILGVGLRITTVAGCIPAALGDGGLVRPTDTRTIVRSGHRLMSPSSDSAVESDSALVLAGARLAGFR